MWRECMTARWQLSRRNVRVCDASHELLRMAHVVKGAKADRNLRVAAFLNDFLEQSGVVMLRRGLSVKVHSYPGHRCFTYGKGQQIRYGGYCFCGRHGKRRPAAACPWHTQSGMCLTAGREPPCGQTMRGRRWGFDGDDGRLRLDNHRIHEMFFRPGLQSGVRVQNRQQAVVNGSKLTASFLVGSAPQWHARC